MSEIFKVWFKNNKKLLALSIAAGFAFTFFISTASAFNDYSKNIREGIASSVIRFHVLANSDYEYDQELKLKVRDEILEKMSPILKEAKNINESKELIIKHLTYIEQIAGEVIYENGYDYMVEADVDRELFPNKEYGDTRFPAGYYDALKIIIGEGEGKNWWCVMYPPLCFVDVMQTEVSEETMEELKFVLTDEEYEIITSKSSKRITPKMKFKIVEIFDNDLRQALANENLK